MKIHIFLLVVLIATAALPGAALAQDSTPTNESESAEPRVVLVDGSPDEPEEFETVDVNTRLVDTRYKSGRMIMVLDSDKRQIVTVTDAGAVMQGGVVPRGRFVLSEGRNRVSFPATKVSGQSALTIETREVLFAVPYRHSTTWIGGPYSQSDVQNAGLAGVFAGVGTTALIALRRVRGLSDEPERLL